MAKNPRKHRLQERVSEKNDSRSASPIIPTAPKTGPSKASSKRGTRVLPRSRQQREGRLEQRDPENELPVISVILDGDFRLLKEIQPDNRGRLTIGHEVVGEQRYRVLINAAKQILLEPIVSIPARELWLFQNHAAFSSVVRGIQQAQQGEVKDLGSFAQFAEGSNEEYRSEEGQAS